MKLSNENKVILGVALIGAGTLGFLYWKNKQNQADDALNDIPEFTEPTATNPIPQTGVSLDRNKLLAKGSKGLEVRELQRLLGIKIDGDFGNLTLTALLAKKRVTQISLNAFTTKTKVKTIAKPIAKTLAKVLPRVGEKLQVIKDTSLFIAKQGANGKYFGTGDKFFSGGDLKYGDSAGTFVDANATGSYLIKIFGGFAFIKADSVKTY